MKFLKEERAVAVLIHGCHLQADLEGSSWEELIWGSHNGPTMAGRVVMGIYVALYNRARLVTFSTGASHKDGLTEAEYTYDFVLHRAGTLAGFLSAKLGTRITPRELRNWLKHRVVLDTTSQNTVEETSSNLALALARKCTEVIGVTNAFHAPRCLAGLQAARITHNSPLLISVVPAHDSDRGTVILEPPHRGDRPKTRWHILARRFFSIPEARREEFEREFEQLADRYK